MKKSNRRPNLRSERGLATIEVIPLILIFVFLMAYTLGAFGMIHTGIMHSITARAYAFETFRNRSNLVYFRDNVPGDFLHHKEFGNRQHGIMSESPRGTDSFGATERPIRVGIEIQPDASRNDPKIHNEKVFQTSLIGPGKRNTQVEVSPAWIMVQYGICLNVKCGD